MLIVIGVEQVRLEKIGVSAHIDVQAMHITGRGKKPYKLIKQRFDGVTNVTLSALT